MSEVRGTGETPATDAVVKVLAILRCDGINRDGWAHHWKVSFGEQTEWCDLCGKTARIMVDNVLAALRLVTPAASDAVPPDDSHALCVTAKDYDTVFQDAQSLVARVRALEGERDAAVRERNITEDEAWVLNDMLNAAEARVTALEGTLVAERRAHFETMQGCERLLRDIRDTAGVKANALAVQGFSLDALLPPAGRPTTPQAQMDATQAAKFPVGGAAEPREGGA